MKRTISIFCIFSSIMLLAIGLLSACSSDDDSKANDDFTGQLIPVRNIDGYSIISEFFNSEFNPHVRSKGFFTDSENDICMIINDKEELVSNYAGTRSLPEIDFQNYTLVIGQKVLDNRYHPLIRQDLVAVKGQLDINLFIPEPNEKMNYHKEPQYLYFWGVYPKFKVKTTSINLIKENIQDNLDISGNTEISQNVAWEIVKQRVIYNMLDDVNVFVSKSIINPITTIDGIHDSNQSPRFASWLLFIDDCPNANWAHPCRFVYVNTIGGEYEIHEGTWPPKTLPTEFIQFNLH